MLLEGNVSLNTPIQQLFDSRPELDKLACDAAKTARDIREFLSNYAQTLTPQQRPALLLLQKKVTQMADGQDLARQLGDILQQLPISADSDDTYLSIIAKMVVDPHYSSDRIKKIPALTPFQVKFREQSESSPEKLLKGVLAQRTAESVQKAGSPFFRACVANKVNPFSLMCAKKEVELNPDHGFSEAHVAALGPNCERLQELYDQNPAHLEGRTPLGGTAWDLLRARGHALELGQVVAYPFGIPRRYLNRNILMANACQALMKLKPQPLEPDEKRAFDQYLERKRKGEKDPVEIFQIDRGPLKGQFGARASREFRMGDFVVAYRGKLIPRVLSSLRQVSNKEAYNLNILNTELCIHALDAGSEGAMINHGSPQCLLFAFEDEGIPQVGLMAGRTILAGEELLYDYHGDYFIGRPEAIELAPQLVDRYLEETHNLSFISHLGIQERNGATKYLQLNISEINSEGNQIIKPTCFSVQDAEARADAYTSARYHFSMLDYICHFPQRAFERLKMPDGIRLADNWVALLDYCKETNQFDRINMSDKEYKALIAQIQMILRT